MTLTIEPGGAELTPDPAAAAARVLDEAGADAPPPPRPRGRPPGSRNKKTPEQERARKARYRARLKAEASEPEEGPAPIEVDEGDIAAASAIGQTVWDIAGPMFRMRPLTEDQAGRLGKALAPIVKKYLPLLADWQHEVNLALVVFALARECALPKADPSEAQVIEEPVK